MSDILKMVEALATATPNGDDLQGIVRSTHTPRGSAYVMQTTKGRYAFVNPADLPTPHPVCYAPTDVGIVSIPILDRLPEGVEMPDITVAP